MSQLPTSYQEFIHLSRYSRWLPEETRREDWEETAGRYLDFMVDHLHETCGVDVAPTHAEYNTFLDAILALEVMPSMRALMTAGPALKRDNVAGYNCAYLAVNSLRAFDEAMYVLMCGTGVGFSVEDEEVAKLPAVAGEFHPTDTTIVVSDSKIGWCKALKELLHLLYQGLVPQWDLSRIRPAGSPLKTFGGRASGPEPLDELFRFVSGLIPHSAGRRLSAIECHDLMCKIADIVVVGGVRRSALISLSSLNNPKMREAKFGRWWDADPQRRLANNSVAYDVKPDIGVFMQEWLSLYMSKSGERGIFNREAAKKIVEKLGIERRDPGFKFGTNPCSEIILRDREFCNLTEVVCRKGDTEQSLKWKVMMAATFGTWQSTLTNFRYLSQQWRKNCEEERLLGVSLTGLLDCPVLREDIATGGRLLKRLRDLAVKTNAEWATKLGIEPAAAVTCVKPSGTVSQLVNSSSGMHPRWSRYYIRTVRADSKDPLCQFMIEEGFPHEPCVDKPASVVVFSFPVESPEDGVYRDDMTAVEQLEMWRVLQEKWCEHKPSITVYVREHEWFDVGAWVYAHFDLMSGVSFLPHTDHVYRQAPYQEVDKATYKRLVKGMPEVDWTGLSRIELEDRTQSSKTLACSGDTCEFVDIESYDVTRAAEKP